ncbi:MAG: hypothetical protein JO253_06870 [Alphaproteobacteria bacterium]|nr:hypothetical protein [Alphaproteobacteria bacterium]
MKILTIVLALVTLALGLRAAWYWRRASVVEVVPLWVKLGQIEPVESGVANDQWQLALIEAGNEAGKLNAIAAAWTAYSVVSGCVTTLMGLMVG